MLTNGSPGPFQDFKPHFQRIPKHTVYTQSKFAFEYNKFALLFQNFWDFIFNNFCRLGNNHFKIP